MTTPEPRSVAQPPVRGLARVPCHPIGEDILTVWELRGTPGEQIAAPELRRCHWIDDRLTAYAAARAVHDADPGAWGPEQWRALVARAVDDTRAQREAFPARVAQALRAAGFEVTRCTYASTDYREPTGQRRRALQIHPHPFYAEAYVSPDVLNPLYTAAPGPELFALLEQVAAAIPEEFDPSLQPRTWTGTGRHGPGRENPPEPGEARHVRVRPTMAVPDLAAGPAGGHPTGEPR